jgi:cytoskeletal protein CcmA (bactofilin family)
MHRKILVLGVLILLLLVPVGVASAQGPVPGSGGDHVFQGENVSLKAGDTFNGALSVLNGNLDMAEGSTVQGDVFVAHGQATIAGQVDGNLAVAAGDVELASGSLVRGDVFAVGGTHDLAGQVNGNVSILFGDLVLRSSAVIRGELLVAPGDLSREEGAQVEGNVVTRLTLPPTPSGERQPEQSPKLTPVPSTQPAVPESGQWRYRIERVVGRVLAVLVLSGVFMLVGALIALIWPRPTQRVAECIAAMPAQSFALGLLTFLLAVGLEVAAVFLIVLVVLVAALLMATVILIPVGLLLILLSGLLLLPVPLALAGGALLGWVGLAELLGRKLLAGLRVQSVSPLGATLVGLLLTVAPAAILWIIHPWCCGWPFVIIVTSIGLGAVFHTRFGTQGCRRAGSSPRSDALPAEPAAQSKDDLNPAEPAALPAEAMGQDAGQPDTPSASTP